jgi:NTP pyrophosphatase (non-canonical NTP hydrolase)
MSGRKYSRVRFDATHERKAQLLSRIDAQRRAVEGIREQVRSALQDASTGLQEYFSAESKRARLWMESVEAMHATSQSPNLSSSVNSLSNQISRQQKILDEGETIHQQLEEAFLRKAGALRNEGARQVFAAESALERARSLIVAWFGSETVEALDASVQELHRHLEQDRLAEVSMLANSLRADVEEQLQKAVAAEEKYHRRIHVLKALRQVCAEMGFEETGPPRAESLGDRGSPIRLTVDTFNRGQVTFVLSLDAIGADSCISDSHCFEEFSELSRQMSEAFGVVTKFQMADGTEPPELRRKGEIDEPSGADRTQGGKA